MPLGGSPVGAAGISAGGSCATLVPPVGGAVANDAGTYAGNFLSPIYYLSKDYNYFLNYAFYTPLLNIGV